MKKIVLVFGTRPEAIKMASLIRALKSEGNRFDVKVCVTGQHREMLDQVLEVFDVIPDYDLGVMSSNSNSLGILAAILHGLENVFKLERPNIVLVHGDTVSSLGGALSAFFHQIPYGHVEAGLRTYNLDAPFPEEFIRQVISRGATWNFAPTDQSRVNLLQEMVKPDSIYVTGNTVIDALKYTIHRVLDDSARSFANMSHLSGILGFNPCESTFILVTCHRRENIGFGLKQICEALKVIALKNPLVKMVFPVHLNPKVSTAVNASLRGIPNIRLVDPLSYEQFCFLLNYCYFVLTDSGGIQEEAPSIGKPVLVMRDFTERTESLAVGSIRLVGTEVNSIVRAAEELMLDEEAYGRMSRITTVYGDGFASEVISRILYDHC